MKIPKLISLQPTKVSMAQDTLEICCWWCCDCLCHFF